MRYLIAALMLGVGVVLIGLGIVVYQESTPNGQLCRAGGGHYFIFGNICDAPSGVFKMN